MIDKRKIVLVGTGFVGMSMAYSLLNQGGINELVLIDIDKQRAIGEAMDLAHGIPCAPSKIDIKAGDYSECRDANIVVISAGVNQKPGQTRLELLKQNAQVMKEVTKNIVDTGFNGIFLIATNPVDLMTYVVQKVSGFPKQKVIGSGTVLDTARLRYLIGKYTKISTRNVHAYIIGEHGDSSFVPWSHCYIGNKKLLEVMNDNKYPLSDLDNIYLEVQQAAYEIIERKKATYYAIGLGLVQIIKAILNDENEILTVSTYIEGEYRNSGMYVGVPTIINRNGSREILEIELTSEEQSKFDESCKILKELQDEIKECI